MAAEQAAEKVEVVTAGEAKVGVEMAAEVRAAEARADRCTQAA